MNAPPFAGIAAAPTPLGRIAAAGLGRVALAALVLVLAAVVVTVSGSSGLGGRLGSLFGLRSDAQKKKPVAPVQVAGPVSELVTAARLAAVQRSRPAPVRHNRAKHRQAGAPRRSPAPTAPRPAPALPAPPPSAPPPSVPHPAPAPGGNVQHAADVVRQTVTPAAPQAQPVVDQTVQTVGQVCGLIGGCP